MAEKPQLNVTEGESRDFGPCECCGNLSRSVWGYVDDQSSATVAAYFVHWTTGRPDHGANFDLVVGDWGSGTNELDRSGVSLLYRHDLNSFTVIDAEQRPFAKDQQLFSRALRRKDVIGTALAATAFAIVDAVWLGDSRIAEVRGTNDG